MSNDVALTAALRNNLLSLQKTQSNIDATQLRLSTGRKVNSALDGPQAFFAAQSLNNRAADLQRLLDSVGQSIQVIKAADNGVTALTTLIEQATSIATSAREATSADAESASITGDTDVSDFEADAAYANATITFTASDSNNIAMTLTGGAINIDTGSTADDIVEAINDIEDADGNQVLEASLNSSGKIQIKSLDGVNFTMTIDGAGGASDEDVSAALASELGFGSIARTNNGGDDVTVTSKAASTLSSAALYQSDAETLAVRSTTLGDLLREAEDGDVDVDVFSAADADNTGNEVFSVTIGLNGSGTTRIDVTNATTLQELIDDINANSVLKNKVEASFNEETGQISIRAKDGSVESIEFGVAALDDDTTADSIVSANFGFGVAAATLTTSTTTQEYGVTESIRLGQASGELGQFEADFNRVRDQIDQLVADAGYRGTNLLAGDDLLTVFNEDRSSSLTTTGVELSSSGLGIDEATFGSVADIDDSLDQVRDALATVRNFGTTLANDLTVIQTRQDFTTNLINTLTEGSDKLTIADQNEEGAKLLSLQTRQQLGVTSLSLASQSQQSILRLF